MSISQLARTIKESPTLALNEAARLLRERGEPVIHLGIGEPRSRSSRAASFSASVGDSLMVRASWLILI